MLKPLPDNETPSGSQRTNQRDTPLSSRASCLHGLEGVHERQTMLPDLEIDKNLKITMPLNVGNRGQVDLPPDSATDAMIYGGESKP